MSSGKNIEIRIAATGGNQAAADIQKPADAVATLGDVTDELAKKNAKALQGREEMLRDVLQGAQLLKDFSRSVAEAGPELDATFGPENAAKIRDFSEGLDNVASAASLAAQGFAVGGPLGAAIGGIVGVLLPDLKKMLEEISDAWKEAFEAQNLLAKQEEDLAVIHRMGINAYADARDAVANYKEETEDLTETLRVQNLELTNRNALLNAKDATDATKRDRDDAAAIRAGADPEDVKSKRAVYDAEVKKQQIQRDIDDAEKSRQAAAERLQRAEKNVEVLQNNPDSPSTQAEADARLKEWEKAKKERDAARVAFEKSQYTAQRVRDIAPERMAQADERAAARVEELEAQKAKRLADEKKRRDEQSEREWEAADRRATARQKSEMRDNLTTAEDRLSGTAAANEARIRKGGKTAGGLQNLAKDIGNADTEREIAAVAAKINASQAQLGAATVAALNQMLAEQQAQAKAIETLRRQIKNK